MFSTIITNFRLSQSAVVIDNLLTMHGIKEIGFDPAVTANKLLAAVNDEIPSIVQGKNGKRPHKLSLAATALAKGTLHHREQRATQLYFHLALGTVLLEISSKSNQYALTGNDHFLLEKAQEIYLAYAA
jgi:hypothetical protein